MNRPTITNRTVNLALMCLVLQFLWVTGFSVHSVCIEADGDHHAERTGTNCSTTCEMVSAGSPSPSAGVCLHGAPTCGDCTDIVVAQAGFRSHHSGSAADLDLPTPSCFVAIPPAPKTVSSSGRPRTPIRMTEFASLPLRC